MIKYDRIIEAQNDLVKYWGDDGKKVIEMCYEWRNVHRMDFDTFLSDYCTACGGDWGSMLLIGIHKLYPDVWDAIPDDMGVMAWGCICSVLTLLGIEPKEKEQV